METKLRCFTNKVKNIFSLSRRSTCIHRFLAVRVNSVFTQLCYFLSISFVGYSILKALNTRPGAAVPRSVDFFFTAVSAATVSSMSAVEMEVFSDGQLLVMTLLMFVGGEVFVSMVGLMVRTYRMQAAAAAAAVDISGEIEVDPTLTPRGHEVELVVVPPYREEEREIDICSVRILKLKSIRFLSCAVMGYLLLIHVIGVSSMSLYIAFEKSARNILEKKGLKSFTFSLFTVVSTFASCGFVPTNENMVVFRKHPIMLLILIPQVLFGNTLFPPCLRLCVWFFGKCSKSYQRYSTYLLSNTKEVGFYHLLPGRQSTYLTTTVAGFVTIQLAMFCAMDWRSEGLTEMKPLQKFVGGLFLAVNSRHSGETIVDLTTISTALLVVFVVMMYLPPYTYFLPTKAEDKVEEEEEEDDNLNFVGSETIRTVRQRRRDDKYKNRSNNNSLLENVMFSQLSYLAVFVVIICITERRNIKDDPLNFNVFNVILEVVR
ncbi:Sodium transporter HKT1 [Linum grandiflorum]